VNFKFACEFNVKHGGFDMTIG